MEFPVDILATLSHDDLEHSAEEYMSDLLYSNPDKAEYFPLPNSRRVPLSISNVGFVPIYGCDLRHKVLALFSPEDQFTALALYLADQWWALEDILKTADPSRKGILKVRSLGERIVLYVLNRMVYRSKEMSKNEVPFLCHSASDYAKILWRNGEAIGFYSVKPSGSLCNSFVTQRYLLPVMDSIYVKKIHRGNGYGLQMLEDFVDSFKEDSLGLKYPISPAMLKVCEQYLNTYPADQELLWEVESVGGPFQRSRVASKLQSIVVSGDVLFHENDVAMDEEVQKETTLTTVEVTEVTVVKNHLRVDTEDTPVSTRTRSSNYRKRIRETELPEESLPDKITRVDDSAKVTLENSEEEAPEEEGQLAPADDENKEEEQPGLNAAEDGDQEEPSPVSEEAVGPVAPESQGQQEDNQTLDTELLEKLDAGQINGEITDDTGEEEGESSDPAAMEENCTQAGEESQKDEAMREAAEDTSESQDTGGTVPEEPEEQTPVVEEALSEEEPPLSVDQQTTLVEEPSPAAEEQMSKVEEINVDERATAGEASSPEDEPSPTEDKNHLEEEELQLVMEEDPAEEAMAVEEPSAAGEAQAECQESSADEDKAADPGQDTVDHPKVSEPEEPASEVTDETALVPDEIPADEEGLEGKSSSEIAPLEMTDSPDKHGDPLEEDSMDQDAVPLDLKETSSHLNGGDDQAAAEEEKTEERPEPDEAEPGKDTEEENAEEERATTTEEEENGVETAEQSSDNANEPLPADKRVRQRKIKVFQDTPKRKSTRLRKKPLEDEQTAPSEPEDASIEKEEEKATTTEEEVEKSSDEADEPPVVDMRVLRRKAKAMPSPSKQRGKRRSKI